MAITNSHVPMLLMQVVESSPIPIEVLECSGKLNLAEASMLIELELEIDITAAAQDLLM